MRNIPLLLQLLVWYGLITELLPPIRQSIELGGLVYLNQRGLRIAWPQAHPAIDAAQWAMLAGIIVWWF